MGKAGAGKEGLAFYLMVPTLQIPTENTEGEAKGVKISEHSNVSFKWKQTPLSNLEVQAQ